MVPFDRVFSLFVAGAAGSNKANVLIRGLKFGKIYKLIRLMRILKLLKLMKSSNKVDEQISSKAKIDGGTERLSFVSLIFFFACHIFACCWILLGTAENSNDGWYSNSTRD